MANPADSATNSSGGTPPSDHSPGARASVALAPGRGAEITLPPLQGAALAIGSVAVSLATFMNVLDASIANVAIPTIAGDLGVSPTQGTWVITSFAVSNAISIPLTGWLSQRFGQVRLFLASTLLFVLASFLCGMAQSIEMLIAFRVLQGAVAGPMIPMSQSLLLASFPKAKAGTAMAVWGVTTLVAPVAGPILGGWISDNYSWPWIFYINVPLGLLAAYATWNIYGQRETATQKLPVDTVGLSLLVLWIAALQLMLDKGRELDWFHSGQIITLAAVAVIGFVGFLIWELNEKHPIVDLTLFRNRNFLGGVTALSLGYGAFFGNVVVLPLWLQTQIGYTATVAGLAMAPVGVFAIVLSPVIGRNLHRVDARLLATAGFLMFAVVLYMRSLFNAGVDLSTVMLPAYLQGIAMALFFTPLSMLMLSGLKPEQIPAASGLSNFVRVLFGGFGSSIATTAWDNRSAMHHSHLMEQANAYNPTFTDGLDNMQQLGLSNEQAHAVFERALSVQASTLGVNDIFLFSSLMFLVLVLAIWWTRPVHGKHAHVDGGGGH
ncbi:DHA2 family efflux MFS transporter permease subunit [Aestuariicella hydrocarbonica]|uniref:DHA2 family efflux MFS transporter permease subunit n=1 Tax=Pseudomaricurvus hydrocarbonicus TaxID=1470433 RepID=A0A9E5MNQ7_9GAMM|nr:DHA2 family efflux MFS transporter permease subunit [Aestuariicella hydrocarbonica]NHO67659.1 DHA2 family efflux MFS transporter permease subunit [Aestuariicella hydrocarbonica]